MGGGGGGVMTVRGGVGESVRRRGGVWWGGLSEGSEVRHSHVGEHSTKRPPERGV